MISLFYHRKWLTNLLIGFCSLSCAAQSAQTRPLQIATNAADGSYSIGITGLSVLRAGAGAKVDGKWLRAADYPRHVVTKGSATGALGAADEWTIRYTGRQDAPELVVSIRSYTSAPFGEMQTVVHNTTGKEIHVQDIRVLDGNGGPLVDLGGPASAERIINDSFSEDRPGMTLYDLSDPVTKDHIHHAVGLQLIYNQQTHRSWFIAALTSDKFLSVMRLHMSPEEPSKIASYEIDSTGTTEPLLENSLQRSPEIDRVELSLPVAAGADLASERMIFSVTDDYLHTMETYGRLIRDLHHARISAPSLMGWWSWTAYYFGLTEGTAETNARWLSENLLSYGFNYFHLDEGYQFARGEYATPDSAGFPHGFGAFEHTVMTAGLQPGIWTAPFEVSERSWVYNNHPDWLVKNSEGKPIHIGSVSQGKDVLYQIDSTNPGAQEYLRMTYARLTREWGVRYIKMDFMEDSAVEGYYFRPNTTALEAQRIGLKIIRDAVGDSVYLDKDGSEMLNPVGILDMGRISQDTGHSFNSSKHAANGIAARFYMNRNYFVADPDAFTVSVQTRDDNGNANAARRPVRELTFDEAKVSMMLAAVAGGMFEIGDDLPTLGKTPERVALLKNRDVLDMIALGRSALPIDLMTYLKEDQQPSMFLLKESDRQTVLTVFNWTEDTRAHHISLADLGLSANKTYAITEVLDGQKIAQAGGFLDISQPAHSVRVLKIVDASIPARPPMAKVTASATGEAGASIAFTAEETSPNDPILHYRWEFDDGVTVDGKNVTHAFTHSGTYNVTLLTTGLNGGVGQAKQSIAITGTISTRFHPETQLRLDPSIP